MADEPEIFTHVLLREIRAGVQDVKGRFDGVDMRFERLEAKIADYRREVLALGRSASLALGRSTQARVDLDDERKRIDELFEKLEKLLNEQPPPSH